MCTAISFKGRDFYFGRTLDTEYDFGEEIVFTRRLFPHFSENDRGRYAIIGMAKVVSEKPLFFDGMNECGLCMAALNYGKLAVYYPPHGDKNEMEPYKLIPYILSTCKNLAEARSALNNITLVNRAPASNMPVAELHFIIADSTGAITVEPDAKGLSVYENELGVLTNAPSFPFHLQNLNLHLNLTANEAENSFSNRLILKAPCRGLGAVGLPGDPSSPSRFIRACFYKFNTPPLDGAEGECVSGILRVLDATGQILGSVRVKDGAVKTRYTACMNANTGMYYYTTYGNPRITAVSMLLEDADGDGMTVFPLRKDADILLENRKI